MKNIIIITALTLIAITQLSAQQDNKNEFSFGYGAASTNSIIASFSDILVYPVSLGTITTENEKSTGILFLGYKRKIVNNLMLGTTVTYEQESKDIKLDNILAGSENSQYFTVSVEASYNYIAKPKFKMYSGLGAGYTLINQKYDTKQANTKSIDENSNRFNFQVTGVGFRYGKDFGVFAELGFGYKGIANIGLSYQF